MKRYRLRDMLWQQSPLTYGEFKRLWTLTRGTGLSASVMSAQGFGRWVDKLVEEDLLPQVAAIILKPYEPTPLHRWWNRWQAKRHNVLSVADVVPFREHTTCGHWWKRIWQRLEPRLGRKRGAFAGVKAVLVESFERIHRSNLVGMGVLPLQFLPGQNADNLGLTGHEVYDILGLDDQIQPGSEVTVRAHREDGSLLTFKAIARLNTNIEVEYYRNGGILHTVLRNML